MTERAFWVGGGEPCGTGGLQDFICEAENVFGERISELDRRIQAHKQKERKGILYWYFWNGERGEWLYCGRGDPRPPLIKERDELVKKMEQKIASMRSCVIAEIKAGYTKHLIVDIELFQANIQKKLLPEIVPISTMIYQGPAVPDPGKRGALSGAGSEASRADGQPHDS